jgi:hypothetical protein
MLFPSLIMNPKDFRCLITVWFGLVLVDLLLTLKVDKCRRDSILSGFLGNVMVLLHILINFENSLGTTFSPNARERY